MAETLFRSGGPVWRIWDRCGACAQRHPNREKAKVSGWTFKDVGGVKQTFVIAIKVGSVYCQRTPLTGFLALVTCGPLDRWTVGVKFKTALSGGSAIKFTGLMQVL